MSASNLLETAVLGHDRQPVLDRCRRDQRIRQLDRAMNPSCPAVGYQASPGDHYRFTDRNRVCATGEVERGRTTCTDIVVVRGKHTQLQLADGHDGYRDPRWQLGRPSAFVYELGNVAQSKTV